MFYVPKGPILRLEHQEVPLRKPFPPVKVAIPTFRRTKKHHVLAKLARSTSAINLPRDFEIPLKGSLFDERSSALVIRDIVNDEGIAAK